MGASGQGASYTFTGDPREFFSQLFGSGGSPFDDILGGGMGGETFSFGTAGVSGNPGSSDHFMDFSHLIGGFGGGGDRVSQLGRPVNQSQDPPVEHTLNLSLEELYSGCVKKMKISRQVSTADRRTVKEDKVVMVDVKRGWKAGTKVTFPKEGDQTIGKIPSDVVFVIGEKKHRHYERDGNDLIYNTKLTLKNALCGGHTVSIPTIDGGTFRKTLNNVITPQMVDHIKGEGMPISKQPGKRGDLLLKYDIQFPGRISEADRMRLAQILSAYQ